MRNRQCDTGPEAVTRSLKPHLPSPATGNRRAEHAPQRVRTNNTSSLPQIMRIDRQQLANTVSYRDQQLRTRFAVTAATHRPLRHWHRQQWPHTVPVIVLQATLLARLGKGAIYFRTARVERHGMSIHCRQATGHSQNQTQRWQAVLIFSGCGLFAMPHLNGLLEQSNLWRAALPQVVPQSWPLRHGESAANVASGHSTAQGRV